VGVGWDVWGGGGWGVPRDENFKKDECVWTWGALGSQMQTKSARVIRVLG